MHENIKTKKIQGSNWSPFEKFLLAEVVVGLGGEVYMGIKNKTIKKKWYRKKNTHMHAHKSPVQ